MTFILASLPSDVFEDLLLINSNGRHKVPREPYYVLFPIYFFQPAKLFPQLLTRYPLYPPYHITHSNHGGITITKCKWSFLTFCSIISHPGIISKTFGKSFKTYALTLGFSMPRRYFGIETIWYYVPYTLWPDTRVSMHTLCPIAAALIYPRASPRNSALRAE